VSAHSPGPWMVGYLRIEGRADIYADSEPTSIASVRAEANAALVAAAPELLAELKAALRIHEDDHCDGCDAGCPLGEGWRQLIAKAEGES